jgi:hypothetical protein
MFHLRQSTTVSIKIGPFVDSTDGNTDESGLTIANTDVKLSKNGGTFAAKSTDGGTYDTNGFYTISLKAADVNTVGTLQLSAHVSGALHAYHEFQVLEEAIYDALYAASAARIDANITHIGGAAVNTASAQLGVNAVNAGGVAWNSGAISSASFASGAINAAAIAADAIGASELATDAVHEISAQVWGSTTRVLTSGTNIALAKGTGLTGLNDLSSADVRSAVGMSAANLDTQLSGMSTGISSILEDTGTTIPGLIAGTTADIASLAADIAALNDLSAAEVNAEVDTALGDIYLDYLFATAYDPSSQPGNTSSYLNVIVENDAGVPRFTANMLELAPSGGLTAGGVRDAVGLASADLDTQLSGLSTDLGTLISGVTVSATGANVITSTAIDASAITEIQADLGTSSELDSILAAIAALNDLSAADINAEMVDVLAVDTYVEPGQVTPSGTTTLAQKIGMLYKLAINRIDQNATTFSLYNTSGTTVDQKSTVSDDGTTFSRGRLAVGP